MSDTKIINDIESIINNHDDPINNNIVLYLKIECDLNNYKDIITYIEDYAKVTGVAKFPALINIREF